MIKRSSNALLVRTATGECASFSVEVLRDDIARAFQSANSREEWMAGTIADTVEDYARLHAESSPDDPLHTADVIQLVHRILTETGLTDVAQCYRRQHDAALPPPADPSQCEWSQHRVEELLSSRIRPSQSASKALVDAVLDHLRHLSIPLVSDELILELARHSAHVSAAQCTVPARGTDVGVLLQPEHILMRVGGPIRAWVREGDVQFLPVRTLLPTVRAVLNVDRLSRRAGPPLTELAFLPLLRHLSRDLRTVLSDVRREVIRQVPHAEAYPVRLTVVRLDETVGRDFGGTAAGVRLAAEARAVVENTLASGTDFPLALKYTESPPAETAWLDRADAHAVLTG